MWSQLNNQFKDSRMSKKPFVVLIGTQSSGSSAIAGVAYHIGVWLGDDLGGRYGHNPDNRCGFEDRTFSRWIRWHVPCLSGRLWQPPTLEAQLRQWIKALTREAWDRGQIPGGKYPHFSVLGNMFTQILGDRLRVIDCHRPLADSIASLQRLWPQEANVATIQKRLWDGKKRFLAAVPAEQRLRVKYYDLLKNPLAETQRIATWLGLTPTPEQLDRAVQIVHPEMQHVGKSR